MKIKLIICAIALLTTGCGTFDRQERRINYTETLDADFGPPSLITDAKQRVVINTKAKVGVGDVRYDGNGQPTKAGADINDLVVKNHPTRIICSEPSPDVAQAISLAFSLAEKVDVKGQGSGSGSMDSSYASSIAQLGERLATVQLLRDKMYRACEAFQNGAISDTSYTLMLARFDKTMASMLASETAAGAFGRSLAALGGNASTARSDPTKPVDLDAVKKKLADAQGAVKNASTELQNASTLPETDDTARIKKKTEVESASTQLTKAVTELTALDIQSVIPAESQSVATAAQSGPPVAGFTGFGQIAGRSAIDANAIERIHANFLEDDASGTIIDACVIALDRIRTSQPVSDANAAYSVVAEAKAKVIEAEKEIKAGIGTGPFALTPKALKEKEAERDEKQQKLDEAKKNFAIAEDILKNVKPLSFADICATMLRNGDLGNNFLIKLQEEKQKKNESVTNLQIEQLKAKTAAVNAEAATIAIIVKNCADSTKDLKGNVLADKYAACISIIKTK